MKTTGVHPVIGELQEHWSCNMTGTGFKQFFWDGGVDGLAKVEGNDLHLLSIHSETIGSGQFREFIRQCKEHYRFIRIWCVLNQSLPKVLNRYGFYGGHDVDQFGQMQDVWDWCKP